jgi:hypothetical protein
MPYGAPMKYECVSILEMADGKITRFRTYFDPHNLGSLIEQEIAGTLNRCMTGSIASSPHGMASA